MKLTPYYRKVMSSITDHRDLGTQDAYTNYISFGHGRNGRRFQLWIWLDHQVQASPVIEIPEGGSREWEQDETHFPKTVRHQDLWGEDYEDTFYGRFEVDTGRLSIITPVQWRLRRVPSSIVNELGLTFNYKSIDIF